MTARQDILKGAILAALGYIAIMAAGMFTAGHLFGIGYFDPRIVFVLVGFEAVMSLFALAMARRLFGAWQCGFGPLDAKGLAWMGPSFVLLAAICAAALFTGTPAPSLLALAIVLTMLLVGFSEELVFRGIVLKGALPALGQNGAILLSAALFASLHSVNVLALMPAGDMLHQLALTFVFGLAMACFVLRTNSLVPAMVFHALWDMSQFLGGIWGASFGPLIFIAVIVNAVMGAGLWWFVLRRRTA